MTQDPKQHPTESVKAELLQNVLEAELHDDATYPWNPSEAYFQSLEQSAPELEVTEAESSAFFTKLEALWQAPEVSEVSKVSKVSKVSEAAQTSSLLTPTPSTSLLLQRLSERAIKIPQATLESIAGRAAQLMESQLSTLDKLVQSVQDSLPQWDVEDLQVMARPYAYAMRGREPELPEDQDWEELSEMEQGRLAMAIARWIITEQENRA